MKVKYYSEDGYTFDTKYQCEDYESSKEELEKFLKENKENYEDLLESVVVNNVRWYKIKNVIDFFLFDHKDDTEEMSSEKTFYDIFQLTLNIKRKFPLWISIEDEAPITNKDKVTYYQTYIKSLQNEIKEKRKTIKELKSLDEILEKKNNKKEGENKKEDTNNENQEETNKIEEDEIITESEEFNDE